jgi:exopolysaccharide biosynthesis polyprenyl glycosylphosphotransferase
MLRENDAVVRRLMMFLDIIVISAAFFLSYLVRLRIPSSYRFGLIASRPFPADVPGLFVLHILFLGAAVPIWCYLLYRNGFYRSWRIWRARNIAWIVFKASAMSGLIFGAAFFLFKLTFMSRLFFLLFAVSGFLFLTAEKIAIFGVMHAIRRRGYNFRQILIVGTGRRAELFIRKIKSHPEWGLRITGAVEDEPGRGITGVDGVKVIGDLGDLRGILHREPIDEVVFVVPRLRLQHIDKAIQECEIEGVKVTVAVDLFDLKIAKAYRSELDDTPLLTFKTTVPTEWELFAKRTMDIILSGLLILLLSPVLLAIAFLIKITSPGPVFFKQVRVGLNKRRFIMHKFRTMVEGAHDDLAQVDIYSEIYGPEWKEKKLAYVTPIGKLLRKSSLDELPQLFDVFLGRMSLVGPRPTLPEEVDQYECWHRRRFSMRPGLTCLWQVNGRREVKFEDWMKMDLEYLDHWSLWLDIKILVKTVPVILFGTGAY